MSVNLSALRQYKNVDLKATVATASPHKLIQMLFEGALDALAQSKGAIERSDLELRTKQLNKASSIVFCLKDSLDTEKGGEIAENLNALYDYILRALMEANRNNDAEKVQEAMNLLVEVKIGWDQMPSEFK